MLSDFRFANKTGISVSIILFEDRIPDQWKHRRSLETGDRGHCKMHPLLSHGIFECFFLIALYILSQWKRRWSLGTDFARHNNNVIGYIR